MKPSQQPKVPVAFRCPCGQKIVIGARWVGKPGGCAGCGREFTIRMQQDTHTGRWIPRISYPNEIEAERVTSGAGGQAKWLNIQCKCGRKIGLDGRFIGRDITCTACKRHLIIKRAVNKKDGHETAKILIAPPVKARARRPFLPGRMGAPVKDAPSEMHLLCTCGEEWIIGPELYNGEMFCSECGALMRLNLSFDPERKKYELEVETL